MVQDQIVSKNAQSAGTRVEKILPLLSTATMIMTLPQIYAIWIEHEVRGVSLLSWGTYLLAACVWFVHGLEKRDKAIYIACVGWVLLDAAVVIGVLVFR